MKKVSVLLLVLLCLFTSVHAQGEFYKKTVKMSAPRQFYGSAVLGDYLYVIGGFKNEIKYTGLCEKSKINPDGTIGSWQDTTSMPANRSYIENSTMVSNDIVYVVGGMDGNNNNRDANTIFWSKPVADGNLGEWKESIPYNGPGVSCAVSVSTPGYIHLIGGSSGEIVMPYVWSARLAPDGSVAEWEKGPDLPMPLWYHSGGVSGGRVFIWGGLITRDKTKTSPGVLSAPILSTGKLGPWVFTQPSLPQPFYSSSSTVTGPYLISFCPRYAGSVASNDIWYASVSPQGLSPWTKLQTTIPSKLYIGIATDYRRGTVYIPGGRIDPVSWDFDDNVYYIKLTGASTSYSDTPQTAQVQTQTNNQSQNLSYIHQQQDVKSTIPGFQPYDQGRRNAQAQNKPMIVYFYSAQAKKCAEQTQILSGANIQSFSDKVIFSEVNVLSYPQISQQNGVFKVPTWIFFDSKGNQKFQHVGILQSNDIGVGVQKIIQ